MPAVPKPHSHELMLAAPYSRSQLQPPAAFKVVQPKADVARLARSLVVLCYSSHLNSVASIVSEVNKRHALRLLLVYCDTDPTWLPQLLERADLRAIRNMVAHSDTGLPKRVLRAWALGAEDALVAKAAVVGDRLFVVACSGRQYDVTIDDIPALARLPVDERTAFAVADDGSYIHWPKSDVHLDIDAIRALIDPAWRDRLLAKRLAHNHAYGTALRRLREAAGVKQSSVAGLSERQVRRMESGESLSADSLRLYAAALSLRFSDFLSAVADEVATKQSVVSGRA
jgi:hypothetical protein